MSLGKPPKPVLSDVALKATSPLEKYVVERYRVERSVTPSETYVQTPNRHRPLEADDGDCHSTCNDAPRWACNATGLAFHCLRLAGTAASCSAGSPKAESSACCMRSRREKCTSTSLRSRSCAAAIRSLDHP